MGSAFIGNNKDGWCHAIQPDIELLGSTLMLFSYKKKYALKFVPLIPLPFASNF